MESNIKEEIFVGALNPVTINGTELILNQMKNSICKIVKEQGQKGTGFFCYIPIPNDDLLPVLITNHHVLNEKDIENKKIIKITLNNDNKCLNITIDESRKKYTNVDLDITIIEIKPTKDHINKEDFLSIDQNINKDESILETLYLKHSIYVLHYQKGKEIYVSYGFSKGIVNKEICHYCNTEEGSSGSPILSLDTFKVIGIHIGFPKKENIKYNVGAFMKYVIEEFNKNVYNKDFDSKNDINKNNKTNKENKYGKESFVEINKNNEANIVYIIGDFDNEIKLFGEEFVKNNKNNCILIIDGKEHELCENINRSELTSKKEKIVKIKIKEIKTITDMSYMFSNCCTLIDLPNISEWDTSSVTNMKGMFNNCEALSILPDISKWDTSNVTDLSYMFNNCISLSSLPNISKWKTTKVSDMSNMFLDCKESLNIPSKFKK